MIITKETAKIELYNTLLNMDIYHLMNKVEITTDTCYDLDATEFKLWIKVPEDKYKYAEVYTGIPMKDIEDSYFYRLIYILDNKEIWISIWADGYCEGNEKAPEEIDDFCRDDFEDYIYKNYKGTNTIYCPNCDNKIIDIFNPNECEELKVWTNDGDHVLVHVCPHCDTELFEDSSDGEFYDINELNE